MKKLDRVVIKGAYSQMRASAIGLRVYACASPNGYVVMPGGLTRAATGTDARVISMQRGGSSKDTWVLSAGPVSTFSLLKRQTGPQDLVRTGLNLSGRVMDAYGVGDTSGEGALERMDAAMMALEALDPGVDLQHGSARLAALLQSWHDFQKLVQRRIAGRGDAARQPAER